MTYYAKPNAIIQSVFDSYYAIASSFLEGAPCTTPLILNLLQDMRWKEAALAFACAATDAAALGPPRETLGREFGLILNLVAEISFGSSSRQHIPAWFLQSWEGFVMALANHVIVKEEWKEGMEQQTVRSATQFVLALVHGVKSYMGLDVLQQSTGVHALLYACDRRETTFLHNGFIELGGTVTSHRDPSAAAAMISRAHVAFMDEIARAVLAESNRDVDSWSHAIGYFAGSAAWRGFSWRCAIISSGTPAQSHHIRELQAVVASLYRSQPQRIISAVRGEAAQELQLINENVTPLKNKNNHYKNKNNHKNGDVGTVQRRRRVKKIATTALIKRLDLT
jgi:hypothetical protein